TYATIGGKEVELTDMDGAIQDLVMLGVHDQLTGVEDSTKHALFLLLDGSRPMTGDLNMNLNDVYLGQAVAGSGGAITGYASSGGGAPSIHKVEWMPHYQSGINKHGWRIYDRDYSGANPAGYMCIGDVGGVARIYIGPELQATDLIASTKVIANRIDERTATAGVTIDSMLVKDGHTIVIGGLFRERTNNSRAQVPGLGNLPGLGYLFRRRTDTTEREEVIILITPHIIKQPIDEAVSEQLGDDIRRFRFGMRQGLMWFGSSRLAQSHMRWARQHVANGATRKAIWDVNMALSMAPRLVAALRLKERLTNQAIWANEEPYSSVNYVIQKMIMQELGLPVDQSVIPAKPSDGGELPQNVRDAMGIGNLLEAPLVPAKKKRPVVAPDNPPTKPESKPLQGK
ncbi:hypothetical protein LCGC14_1848140, partial [marine sediment metagenome]